MPGRLPGETAPGPSRKAAKAFKEANTMSILFIAVMGAILAGIDEALERRRQRRPIIRRARRYTFN